MVEETISINKLFEEIVKNRSEIKNFIEATETRIVFKVEELKFRLDSLEKDNTLLQTKIENLERANKKNNIVIFGLNKSNIKLTGEYITQELNKLLDIKLLETDLNNAYALGKAEGSPVKVEFISYLKKQQVLRNGFKLKGTGISIAHDQTNQEREENKILRKHLLIARENSDNTCYIKKNRLFINDIIYTPAQLIEEDTEESIVNETRINSAPTTPTIIKQFKPTQNLQETLKTITPSSAEIGEGTSTSAVVSKTQRPLPYRLKQTKNKKTLRSNSSK